MLSQASNRASSAYRGQVRYIAPHVVPMCAITGRHWTKFGLSRRGLIHRTIRGAHVCYHRQAIDEDRLIEERFTTSHHTWCPALSVQSSGRETKCARARLEPRGPSKLAHLGSTQFTCTLRLIYQGGGMDHNLQFTENRA